ncbi:unnamed protein product [Durusdinium trenchii]|uniref:Glycosyl transferase CAP10 domain-containing protein n=2 Tax=Durusdinium trenchii TaxID=1381693 RepID=A0ABP0RMJ7_9DINO
MTGSPHARPKEVLPHFAGVQDGKRPMNEQKRFCHYHISGGKMRHCNFTERGYHPRQDLRARIVARAMMVLHVRGELPDEVNFVLSHSDIEWHDLKLPVLTFQRGKATRRVIRVPMWEQLDGSWSRKVEQLVLSNDGARTYDGKRGQRVFWRGTDSAVPAQDCDPQVHVACHVDNSTLRYFSRLKVSRMSRQLPRRIDASLSGVKQRAVAIGLDAVYRRLGVLDESPREVSIEEQLQQRFLLDMDGSSQSTRLYWALLSNSVVFKQDTKACNWYSDRLRHLVHVVRVRRDLSDLPRQVRHMLLRPSLARSVARRGAQLARLWLSHEDAMHYLARVLAAVADAQRGPSARSKEIYFVWSESEELMLEFAQSVPYFAHLPREEALRHRALRWNPLWWLSILGCAACILLGHGFHTACCQGGQVRSDELEVERRARIWWVYCYSGGFVGTVLTDLIALVSAVVTETDPEERNRTVRSCEVAILIQIWYMVGDWNLLYRMSRKDTVLMHAAAISRVTFGAAFLVAFVIGLLTPAGEAILEHWFWGRAPPPPPGTPKPPPPPQETAITWIIRLVFCAFMVIAYLGYTPLLRLDYQSPDLEVQDAQNRGIWKLKVALVAGVLVLAAEGLRPSSARAASWTSLTEALRRWAPPTFATRSFTDQVTLVKDTDGDGAPSADDATPTPFRPHPMSLRFAYTTKPFFPIYTRNLRDLWKRKKGKKLGKGMQGDRGLYWRSKRQKGKQARTWERGNFPLFKRLPRWPEAHMRGKRDYLDPLNLSKLRYFIQKGRLDTRFPITQRHLQESRCVKRVKKGVKLFNVNDFPFPYKIDIEVASADQSSIDAIKAVGGTVTVVYMERVALRAHIKPWKYEVLPRTARPGLKMTTYMEKMKARGAIVRYIKPLWLIEEEKRLQTQLRELRGEDGAAVARRLVESGESVKKTTLG